MLKTVSSATNAIGALNFKGTWNASTNTPTIVSGVGVKGDYFVVGVAGSTTIDGISNWGIGDWIAYNGNIWQRVEGGADLNGVNLSVSGTTTLSGLTASTALALDASKEMVSVTNTGTGDNVLGTSPTMTTPRVVTSLNDTNGNEVFGITATASAVNEMTVANAAAGSNPALSATGGDTNIGVVINTKGTGKVGINKAVPVALLDINGAEALANGNPGGGTNAGLLSFSTRNDGGGANISRNSFINPPFIGILFAYEIGTNKSFTGIVYKQDATTTSPVITQIHSTGSLVVGGTNAAGTIALSGFTTSANVRMMLLQVNSITA